MMNPKITSLEQIAQLRERLHTQQQSIKIRVLICMTGCRALGAASVAEQFKESLAGEEHVAVVEAGCIGLCAIAPTILIEPFNYLYGGVKPEDVEEIIETTIRQGKPLERLAVKRNDMPEPNTRPLCN